MSGKTYYPIFLDLADARVTVIGAGKVGLRKARGAVEAGARVTVVAPRFDDGFDHLAVERVERAYRTGDLDGSVLVFAATDSREVNRRVGQDARTAGIPVNVADAPEECAFIVPARALLDDGVQIAVSTGGADPRRAVAIRREIEARLRRGSTE